MPIYPFYILPGDPPRMYSSPLLSSPLLSSPYQSSPLKGDGGLISRACLRILISRAPLPVLISRVTNVPN